MKERKFMLGALIAFGLSARLGPIYFASMLLVGAALVYEHRSAPSLDLAAINRAFFQSISFMGADVLYVHRFNFFSQSHEDWIKMQKTPRKP